IRITKVETHSKTEYLAHLKKLIGDGVSEQNANRIIQSMFENEVITIKEAKIINAAVERETLMLELPYRDTLRASILRRVIDVILYSEEREDEVRIMQCARSDHPHYERLWIGQFGEVFVRTVCKCLV